MSNHLRLSSSKIATLKRCSKKYYFRYVEKLQPRITKAPPRLGTMVHDGLRAHWMGEDPNAAIEFAWKQGIAGFPFELQAEDTENYNLAVNVVNRWIQRHKYFRSPDEYDYLPPEYRFSVVIPTPGRKSKSHTELIGYFDRVIMVPGEGIWLVEHKSTEQSLDGFFENLDLHEQLDYYLWALDYKFGKHQPVMGAIVNGIKLKMPKKPDVLKSGDRLSKAKIETDYETYLQAILENGFDPADYTEQLERLSLIPDPFMRTEWIDRGREHLRNIEEELYWISREVRQSLKLGSFTRTRSTGRCGWDCEYKELCLASLKGGDIQGIIEDNFTTEEERETFHSEQPEQGPF